ncbi:MAG: 4-hydroxy-tetrahydrodipicolinate synthase [Ignavibacteriae bacterium]|nr:4-hydroxy-tetrahydrodipicolinate synthase [Ignavibacteriota bacterium]
MAKTKRFQGTGTAIVTPFKKDGSLDESALRKFIDFQIKGGVEAIVPVGTTGEGPTLSANEHQRVFEITVEQANGRAKIFGGTGSNNTEKAIEQTRMAKSVGLDAALIAGPYYNKPTQEGYFQHYRAIAEAVDIPIIVYNVPGRTGGNIEAATTVRMAEKIPNIIAIKEASANIGQMMEIARNRPAHLSLLSGDDAFTLPLMSVGGDGCISVVANETPREFSDMVRAVLANNWEKARKLHEKLLPLMNANFIESNPIPVKAALAMMGMIKETYRLPLVPIGAKNKDKLKAILKELDLL